MAMNGYVDDMMCEGLFDNIEDLLDFSTDDEVLGMEDSSAPSPVGGGGGDGDGGAIQMPLAVVSTAAASFPPSDGEGCRVSATSDETKICDEINIHEDWITNFLDDSNFDIEFPAATGLIAAAAAPPSSDYIGGNGKDDDDSLFQSFSPVSVLDEPNNLSNDNGGSSSSSSSSTSSSRTNETTADTVSLAMAPVGPTMMLVPARARSKRPRRAAPAPAHVAVPIVPPASEGPPAVPTLLPECESFGESEPCALPQMKKMKKKKKSRQSFVAGSASADDATAVRKCQHCGIQKTPQWRAGPMGPKTLCNACGVRYKSGRLFPEYRPAASPTFVPSIHSNSHKKVVEMRIKACQQKAANGMPLPEYPAAKNCDLLAYIRRRE